MPKLRTTLIPFLLGTSLLCHAEPVTERTVAEQYATIVHASYQDSLGTAKAMQTAINTLIAAPSEAALAEARKQWLAAREFYGQTEAYRFASGPIDADGGPESRMNSWPMDEAYVDYVKGAPKSGLINNPKVKISREALTGLNQKNGEENVSTGWHAIEFLLWGQDLRADGPGDRKFTDFVDGKAPNADRRRQYLQIVTDLLVDDLAGLVKAWEPNADNYRTRFIADPAAMQKILTGIGVLSRGELAGQRMEVALSTKSQEDEHSCFSDNTHRDIVTDAQGIQNVWEGRYVRADGSELKGASLYALIAGKDVKVADKTRADIANSVKLASEIHAPFDQEMLGKENAPGRKRIRATIDSLKAQANDLVQAAKLLGIKNLSTKA